MIQKETIQSITRMKCRRHAIITYWSYSIMDQIVRFIFSYIWSNYIWNGLFSLNVFQVIMLIAIVQKGELPINTKKYLVN